MKQSQNEVADLQLVVNTMQNHAEFIEDTNATVEANEKSFQESLQQFKEDTVAMEQSQDRVDEKMEAFEVTLAEVSLQLTTLQNDPLDPVIVNATFYPLRKQQAEIGQKTFFNVW